MCGLYFFMSAIYFELVLCRQLGATQKPFYKKLTIENGKMYKRIRTTNLNIWWWGYLWWSTAKCRAVQGQIQKIARHVITIVILNPMSIVKWKADVLQNIPISADCSAIIIETDSRNRLLINNKFRERPWWPLFFWIFFVGEYEFEYWIIDD